MKKWVRLGLIAAALIALTLGVLYELATHVGRGWVGGEAFYEGRPTSYWRDRCDEFLDCFDSPLAAIGCIAHADGAIAQAGDPDFGPPTSSEIVIRFPPKTMWRRFHEYFRADDDASWRPPGVLLGAPDAEAVLNELAAEEKYRILTVRALRNVKANRVAP